MSDLDLSVIVIEAPECRWARSLKWSADVLDAVRASAEVLDAVRATATAINWISDSIGESHMPDFDPGASIHFGVFYDDDTVNAWIAEWGGSWGNDVEYVAVRTKDGLLIDLYVHEDGQLYLVEDEHETLAALSALEVLRDRERSPGARS